MKALNTKEMAKVNGGLGGVNDLTFKPRRGGPLISYLDHVKPNVRPSDTWYK